MRRARLLCLLALPLAACGDDPGSGPAGSLAEQWGLNQYSGTITLTEESRDGNVTVYQFDPDEGPMCMRGDTYRVSARDTGSDDLLIFLQGGGACWSAFCLAVTVAPPIIPAVDVLNTRMAVNPVKDWNVVYLPYCDGSFYGGDSEIDDNINDKGIRYHHGLANLTAGLEVAAARFPAPRRLLLAGSSGGAYGLLLGAFLARHYFPDAELILMFDSGIGIARDGDPAYVQVPLDEFNLTRFLPDDCPRCLDNGHLTGLLGYLLEHDDNVRAGMFSSWYDAVLAKIFLQIPGSQFARGLSEQTGRVHDEFPDRFRRFIMDGTTHTTLLGDPSGIVGTDYESVELPPDSLNELMLNVEIGKLRETHIGEAMMAYWFAALIDGDRDVWVDLLEEHGPEPDWD